MRTDSNQKTIDSYDEYAKEYVKNTPTIVTGEHKPEMKAWIDKALENTVSAGKIFEIGSATLRDATYMRQQGYSVTCSDVTPGFIEIMKEQGEPVLSFNVLKDKIVDQYDMVFANGVFPHFTPQETAHALDTIYAGLSKDGIFAFSIKYGTGEEWIKEKSVGERFTHYWDVDELHELLKSKNFEVIFENNNIGSFPSHRWLNIVARKK